MTNREFLALIINGILHRLPLVLQMLNEIHESKRPPWPGDDELRHGSLCAIRTMIERLDRIAPMPCGLSKTPSLAEEIAAEWLAGDQPRRLLPAPLLDQLTAAISRLIFVPTDSPLTPGNDS